MKRRFSACSVLLLACLPVVVGMAANRADRAAPVTVCINPDQVAGRIDPHVYGFLLEHLYHSVSNGIWGENVWNRSFEEPLAEGSWTADTQGHLSVDARGDLSGSRFTIARMRDGIISLNVRRVQGSGYITIGFRDQHRENLETNTIKLHLGYNGTGGHIVECRTGWVWHTPVNHVARLPVASVGIDMEQWFHAEIRLAGAHVSVALDGQTVFDREVPDCPSDGVVTLGAVDCEAEMKDIALKDSSGADVPADLNLCRHWQMTGDCASSIDSHHPLNQSRALTITNRGSWAGIEQPGKYYVRRADAQCGSVFLRGTVGRVLVQMVKDGVPIAHQTVQIDGSEQWKEYSLSLPVSEDARDVSLQILTREQGWFCVDQVSLMHRSSVESHGFRRELHDAVADIRPTMLRWPGGSFSELYRFWHGLGPQHERLGIYRWDDFDPLSFGIDEYIRFCRSVGADPQIVVPIGYHNYAGYAPDLYGREDWLRRALDWLEYCNGDTATHWGRLRASYGHPEPYNVKYWEIDNEVWKMDPHLYAQLTRIFSIAMKAKDPSIRIIGCGCGRLGAEGKGLDSIMIHDVGEYIDYISPHYYQLIDRYGNEGVEEYGRYLDQLARWIDGSGNPDMKIYLSEWNLAGVDMRTGLFAGGFLNRLERTPRLEMAAPALMLRHVSVTGWDNAFINFDQNRWFPAPNYVVMKLWRQHYLPVLVATEGDCGPLNLSVTRSEAGDTLCVKVVNPGSEDVPLGLEGLSGYSDAVWDVVRADSLTSRNTLAVPDAIRPVRRKVCLSRGRLSVSIPALSASVLSFTIRGNDNRRSY